MVLIYPPFHGAIKKPPNIFAGFIPLKLDFQLSRSVIDDALLTSLQATPIPHQSRVFVYDTNNRRVGIIPSEGFVNLSIEARQKTDPVKGFRLQGSFAVAKVNVSMWMPRLSIGLEELEITGCLMDPEVIPTTIQNYLWSVSLRPASNWSPIRFTWLPERQDVQINLSPSPITSLGSDLRWIADRQGYGNIWSKSVCCQTESTKASEAPSPSSSHDQSSSSTSGQAAPSLSDQINASSSSSASQAASPNHSESRRNGQPNSLSQTSSLPPAMDRLDTKEKIAKSITILKDLERKRSDRYLSMQEIESLDPLKASQTGMASYSAWNRSLPSFQLRRANKEESIPKAVNDAAR